MYFLIPEYSGAISAHCSSPSDGADKVKESCWGAEATVEAEGKFIEAASQMFFVQAMVGFRKKGLCTGNQDVYPMQSAVAFINDLIVMDVGPLECNAKKTEGVTVDLASGTNDLLGDSIH